MIATRINGKERERGNARKGTRTREEESNGGKGSGTKGARKGMAERRIGTP